MEQVILFSNIFFITGIIPGKDAVIKLGEKTVEFFPKYYSKFVLESVNMFWNMLLSG